MRPTRAHAMRAGLLVATLLVSWGASASSAAQPHDSATLTLVAYSTPREAYAAIIPAFQKTPAGHGVRFQTSYGGSGEQSRAVAAGLLADIVAFALEPDITRLVKAGLVARDWNKDRFHGMVTDSVVVLAVRPGNPKHIHTWSDLLKPGVEVITPNPFTSGGARWNVMAAYGAQLRQGKSPTAAVAYVRALFGHVSVQDKSARESMQTFAGGKGDVLIAYENEAITARHKGVTLQYIIPAQTILIENPVAVTTTTAHPVQARAFVDFLWTPTAQRLFGEKGYRPVVASVAKGFSYHRPPGLFTITSLGLGGWTSVTTKFFDPQNGIMAQIERERGVGVGSG